MSDRWPQDPQLLPRESSRLYSASHGPQRMTLAQAIAYCGGYDALQSAIERGYVEDHVPDPTDSVGGVS